MFDLKYRPRAWADFAVASRAERAVRALRKRAERARDGGMPWNQCICGPSGVGKSTAARLLAHLELGADPCHVETIPSARCSPDVLRDMEYDWHHTALFGSGWRVLIIEEAHMLSAQAVNVLLTMAEADLPKRAIILTTTTRQGELFGGPSGPLGSRFSPVWLTAEGLAEPGAQCLKRIAQAEGINGKADSYYVKLMQTSKNNLRAAVCALEDE